VIIGARIEPSFRVSNRALWVKKRGKRLILSVGIIPYGNTWHASYVRRFLFPNVLKCMRFVENSSYVAIIPNYCRLLARYHFKNYHYRFILQVVTRWKNRFPRTLVILNREFRRLRFLSPMNANQRRSAVIGSLQQQPLIHLRSFAVKSAQPFSIWPNSRSTGVERPKMSTDTLSRFFS